MNLKDFWYIACECKDLRTKVISRRILGEWIALFRDEDGKAVALRDRCLHRSAPLSKGKVIGGNLVCPYHGWQYNGLGEVVRIPSEGPAKRQGATRRAPCFAVCEQQGYVYVRLADRSHKNENLQPFSIPFYGTRGYRHVRLVNRFQATVTNCAENFVDIPHTVFIHPGIFRSDTGQKLEAEIVREAGSVKVNYRNESTNLGWFSRFLNPGGHEIVHNDHFYMPNITSVEYHMGPARRLFINSQMIASDDGETIVYTDLTFNYGIWNRLTAPIIKRHAQAIINQDIEILGDQSRTIDKYGDNFQNSAADLIHVYIESIRERLEKGEDPTDLPQIRKTIEFWV